MLIYYPIKKNYNQTIPIADTGQTNSFGGGGSEHFGGYSGIVKHKSFTEKMGEYSLIKTNESMIGCINVSESQKTLLGLVTLFFALAIIISAIAVVFSSAGKAGLV